MERHQPVTGLLTDEDEKLANFLYGVEIMKRKHMSNSLRVSNETLFGPKGRGKYTKYNSLRELFEDGPYWNMIQNQKPGQRQNFSKPWKKKSSEQ